MYEDIVIPQGNENELISMAKRLGYGSILLLYDFDSYINDKKALKVSELGIKIHIGVLTDNRTVFRAREKLRKYRFQKPFIAASGSLDLLEVLEQSKANLVFGLENSSRKDFMHQRASGLNHTISKLARDKNIMVGFSLDQILKFNDPSVILGRISQNIRICRKYNVKTIFASFAKDPFMMRDPKDLATFFKFLSNSFNK
jgi:RNase P/RNase MRP subunit p30